MKATKTLPVVIIAMTTVNKCISLENFKDPRGNFPDELYLKDFWSDDCQYKSLRLRYISCLDVFAIDSAYDDFGEDIVKASTLDGAIKQLNIFLQDNPEWLF